MKNKVRKVVEITYSIVTKLFALVVLWFIVLIIYCGFNL